MVTRESLWLYHAPNEYDKLLLLGATALVLSLRDTPLRPLYQLPLDTHSKVAIALRYWCAWRLHLEHAAQNVLCKRFQHTLLHKCNMENWGIQSAKHPSFKATARPYSASEHKSGHGSAVGKGDAEHRTLSRVLVSVLRRILRAGCSRNAQGKGTAPENISAEREVATYTPLDSAAEGKFDNSMRVRVSGSLHLFCY